MSQGTGLGLDAHESLVCLQRVNDLLASGQNCGCRLIFLGSNIILFCLNRLHSFSEGLGLCLRLQVVLPLLLQLFNVGVSGLNNPDSVHLFIDFLVLHRYFQLQQPLPELRVFDEFWVAPKLDDHAPAILTVVLYQQLAHFVPLLIYPRILRDISFLDGVKQMKVEQKCPEPGQGLPDIIGSF